MLDAKSAEIIIEMEVFYLTVFMKFISGWCGKVMEFNFSSPARIAQGQKTVADYLEFLSDLISVRRSVGLPCQLFNKLSLLPGVIVKPKVRVLTVAKSDERIKSMIKVNKELHDLGNGYNLFMFTKYEAFDIQKPERIFKQIWINGQGRKDSLLQ